MSLIVVFLIWLLLKLKKKKENLVENSYYQSETQQKAESPRIITLTSHAAEQFGKRFEASRTVGTFLLAGYYGNKSKMKQNVKQEKISRNYL